MSEPLENLYFNWLCGKVVDTRENNPDKTYWTLFKILHTTEFVWLISGDDNRAADGKELRREFLILGEIPDDPFWRGLPCSVFEMFIAFSRRAEYMTSQSSYTWFWEFLLNLGLKKFNDETNPDPQDIVEILDWFVWRLYSDNGLGGMFPMEDNEYDQTKLQIWYQFCDYLTERDRAS